MWRHACHGEGATAEVGPQNWKKGHSGVPLPATEGAIGGQWKGAGRKTSRRGGHAATLHEIVFLKSKGPP